MERASKETSELGEPLLFNPGHTVNWEILINASKQVNKQKISDAFYARTFPPNLNNQLNIKSTLLFRNGITWYSHEWLIFTWFFESFLMYVYFFFVTFSNHF